MRQNTLEKTTETRRSGRKHVNQVTSRPGKSVDGWGLEHQADIYGLLIEKSHTAQAWRAASVCI